MLLPVIKFSFPVILTVLVKSSGIAWIFNFVTLLSTVTSYLVIPLSKSGFKLPSSTINDCRSTFDDASLLIFIVYTLIDPSPAAVDINLTTLLPVTKSYSPVPVIVVVGSTGTASTVALLFVEAIVVEYSNTVGLNFGVKSQNIPVDNVISVSYTHLTLPTKA